MKAGKFVSNYLKATDIKAPQAVTIRAAKEETVGIGEKEEDKLVLYFAEIEQGVVMNKTNLNFFIFLYGDETENWIGKKVTLKTELVQFQGKFQPGIRFVKI